MDANDLPVGGPTEPVDPNLTDEQAAFDHMAEVIGNWALMEQLNGTAPMVAAAKMLHVMAQVLQEAMGRGAVRMALLMTFEKTHDEPMSFIQRKDAKDTLDQIVQMRRKVEGGSGLILPGSPDALQG